MNTCEHDFEARDGGEFYCIKCKKSFFVSDEQTDYLQAKCGEKFWLPKVFTPTSCVDNVLGLNIIAADGTDPKYQLTKVIDGEHYVPIEVYKGMITHQKNKYLTELRQASDRLCVLEGMIGDTDLALKQLRGMRNVIDYFVKENE
jgi:hypothetical protein